MAVVRQPRLLRCDPTDDASVSNTEAIPKRQVLCGHPGPAILLAQIVVKAMGRGCKHLPICVLRTLSLMRFRFLPSLAIQSAV
jgi:hypothetical protein